MIIEAHALFSWDEFKCSLDVCRTTNGPLIETVTGYQKTLRVFRYIKKICFCICVDNSQCH